LQQIASKFIAKKTAIQLLRHLHPIAGGEFFPHSLIGSQRAVSTALLLVGLTHDLIGKNDLGSQH
jgi:hypothetical protein